MSCSSLNWVNNLWFKLVCVSSSSSNDDYSHGKRTTKRRARPPTSLEHLPNELFLEVFTYLSLYEIYSTFYDLNERFEQLIVFSCTRGFVIRNTEENNLYLKYILPHVSPRQVQTLNLWHNSSYEQLLAKFPINLSLLHRLVLKRLKNVSFCECRQLIVRFPQLTSLTMIDFNTAQVDWLDDNHWTSLIDTDLPHLRHLDVRICVIYLKQVYDDDKDNIIYSHTRRSARPHNRLYSSSLLKRDPILEIGLSIHRTFPSR